MIRMDKSKTFKKQKEEILKSVDLSRKGSVDSAILELVNFINQQDTFVTTSSCSGRIIVYEEDTAPATVQKQGCHWLHTTHDTCQTKGVEDAVSKSQYNAFFKFEPFVMHVQCQELQDAQTMHSAAVASGFRNSGISVSRKGKIITAIRSTHSLEVPLTSAGKLLVSSEYIKYLVDLSNKKMEENLARIQRFYDNICAGLAKPVERHEHSTSKKKRPVKTDLSQKTNKSRHTECKEQQTKTDQNLLIKTNSSDDEHLEDLSLDSMYEAG